MVSNPIVAIIRARIVAERKGCVHGVLVFSEDLESRADTGSGSKLSDFFLHGRTMSITERLDDRT